MIQDFTITLKQDFRDLQAAYNQGKKLFDSDPKNDDTLLKVALSAFRIFLTFGMAFGAMLTLSAFAFRPFGAILAGIIGISTIIVSRDFFVMSKNYIDNLSLMKQIEQKKWAYGAMMSNLEQWNALSNALQNKIIHGTLLNFLLRPAITKGMMLIKP